MGKKNRSNKDSKASKSKPEEDAIVSSLLEKTSSLPATNAKEQWNEYVAIRELLDKIQKIQVVQTEETHQRVDFLPKFSEWLKENDAAFEKLEVYSTSDSDCGVRALATCQAGDKILNIPRKLILTSEYSTSTFLGSIIQTDKLLRVMPNVVLALKLLNESHKEDSFWKPYIDILPRKFSTPLFFSQEELSALQGSQVLNNVLNLYRSIARQYAYLYQVFKRFPANNKLNFMKSFTYSQYRWAVSIVMTRQNQIPCSAGGHGLHLALIPFLDMCNHCEGHFTTDYDLSTDSCVCFALDSYKSGDEVFIFYGPRSNSDFFVHSGFFYEENKHDLLQIKLGISSSDSLYTLKTQLLSKVGVNVKNLAVTNAEFPLTNDLLGFLRIFCITEDEGKQLAEETVEKLQTLFCGHSTQVSKQNEEKVWGFLETRCLLLLRQYPATKEQDDETLGSCDLSENTRLAVKLRRNEKLLLINAMAFCKDTKERLVEKTKEK